MFGTNAMQWDTLIINIFKRVVGKLFSLHFFFICLGMLDVSVECAGGTRGGGNLNILSSEKFKTSNFCKPLFTVIMTHSKIKLFCVGHAMSF
jgi:hypothetical protein